MALVQVVIPNWNGRYLLEDCLESLARQTCTDFSITVVDNGSTDGTVTWLEKTHPSIQIIANSQNRGFAAAVNQGIAAGTSRYVATLNNDTRPEPAWLENLVLPMEQDMSVGMCASKMLFAHRPNIINSAGISLDWVGIAWDRCGGELNDEHETQPQEVFGACAGAALYRRELLNELNGFEEYYFAYLEDVDLAWRSRFVGWHCLYVPNAVVYHHHSATAVEGSHFKNYLLARNKLWLIAKNYPMPHLLKYFPLIVSYDLASVIYTILIRRDWSSARGRWIALRGVLPVLRKRRKVQSNITTIKNWSQALSPIELPWHIQQRYQHLQHSIKQMQ